MIQKFVLIIVFFLFSSHNVNAKNFNWVDKVEDELGSTEFYIDKKSIKKIDNYVYYWTLANYLKYDPGENKEVKSVIAFNRIDCDDMGYQIVLMSIYDDYNGKGGNLAHLIDPDTEEEKRYDPENSISYQRHKKICN
jgi:hypothetical protein